MLTVLCDDGSTNVKLAWLKDGEVKTSISGNSFKEGWNADILGTGKIFNHHALLTSGLEPQDIELTVTLPVTEFFDSDNQPNKTNINNKKNNILRSIFINKGETFKIKKVNVMPESLPAAIESIIADDVKPLERSLVVDLGGTTLDCGIIQGAFDSVTAIKGNNEIGTSRITRTVMKALENASTPVAFILQMK